MQTIILQDLPLLTNIQNTKYTTDYLGHSYCYSMININNLSSIIKLLFLNPFASYYFRNYYHIMCACLTAIRRNRCNATFYLHIMHMLVLTESILCSKIWIACYDMLSDIYQIFCRSCSFLCFLGMHYTDDLHL